MIPEARSTLVEINIDDLLRAWGLEQVRIARRLLRWLARPPAIQLARQVLAFDHQVGQFGLQQASSSLLRVYTGGLKTSGRTNIPQVGPLLILSNHPGLSDTVALFSAIDRQDLRIIALDRPFLQALPNTARVLYMLPDAPDQRAAIARKVARDLKRGGAALTFPAGQIEPDPLVMPGATDALAGWANSVGLFVRLVPELQIVVAVVGGVMEPAALHHPLTRLRRRSKDRELLGATLQLAWPAYRRNVVSVAFAPPLNAAALLEEHGEDVGRITRHITRQAQEIIENWPTAWETLDL